MIGPLTAVQLPVCKRNSNRFLQFLTVAAYSTFFLWCSVFHRHKILQIKHEGFAYATRQATENATLQIGANGVY